jgi:hypothetical protein
MDQPTVLEDLFAEQECPKCGKKQPQLRSTEEWLVIVFDEISELKKANARLFRKCKELNEKFINRSKSIKRKKDGF